MHARNGQFTGLGASTAQVAAGKGSPAPADSRHAAHWYVMCRTVMALPLSLRPPRLAKLEWMAASRLLSW